MLVYCTVGCFFVLRMIDDRGLAMAYKSKNYDQSQRLLKRLSRYEEIKTNKVKVRNHLYQLMRDFVKKPFGLESEKIEGRYIWAFHPDSEAMKGEVSIGHVGNILIRYRNRIKTMGIVHPDFKKSVTECRKNLIRYGVPEEKAKGIKSDITLKHLEERISLLSKEFKKGSSNSNWDLIRSSLSSIRIYHPFYYSLLSPLKHCRAISNDQDKKSLKAKHDYKVRINHDFLYSKAREVLNDFKNQDWVSLTVALCALTGRRPTEIMKTGSFRSHPEKDNYVLFNGILKSRDRFLDDDFGNFPIPVFEAPTLIKSALRSLRMKLRHAEKKAEKDGRSNDGYLKFRDARGKDTTASVFDKRFFNSIEHNKAINAQYNPRLNEFLKEWFDSDEIEMKSLRAIYTKAVYEMEESITHETYPSLTNRVLCYSTKSLSKSVQNYAAIELDTSIERISTPKIQKAQDNKNSGLLNKLEKFDRLIELKGQKAKKLPVIHQWLKTQLKEEKLYEEPSVKIIRRDCRVNDKKVNSDTAALYLVVVDLVDEIETSTKRYHKDPNGIWLITDKKTNETKSLI